ncbi:Origin recognition complex subunit 5 [Orobanche hederae]
MDKDERPQISKRTTRSSSCITPDSKFPPEASAKHLQSPSINDLVVHGESMSLDELLVSFPERRAQIHELIRLLGPLNSPMFPLFVYGGASTGKTSTILQIFKHLKRPFVYCSCISCYSPRILFESVLNQLLLHTKNESNGYSSAKRCEKPSDFVSLLREALSSLIDSLKGNQVKSGSKKSSSSQVNGTMVYLIFDNIEVVGEWDKSFNIVPLLFNLYDMLKMPELGLIYISKPSLDTFQSDTGFVEPFPVHFPDYTDDDLHSIFMKKQANHKLCSSFLGLVLHPFYRITRRVDELSSVFSPLFKKYCEPLDDLEAVPNDVMKRKLFSHIQPFISQSLNETFSAPSRPLFKDLANKERNMKSITRKLGVCETSVENDFHMSTSAKYLLISAFLASRNPATLDASLFDSTGGLDNRKRKRKSSEKSMERKETKEHELLMKGPGTFPLERLLAIFQCITSVAEYSPDGEELQSGGIGDEGSNGGLMSDILLQLSSLCSANFITKGGSCPLEGSTRYRSTVSEDIALKVVKKNHAIFRLSWILGW